jgi:hypothetical protein
MMAVFEVVAISILIAVAVIQVGCEIFCPQDYEVLARRHDDELIHIATMRGIAELEKQVNIDWGRGLYCPVHRRWHAPPVCDPEVIT